MNFDVMVTLATISARTSNMYTIRSFNCLHFSVYFNIFERTVDFFVVRVQSSYRERILGLL